MSEQEIEVKVAEFIALPRAERKATFAELEPEVRKRARKILERRRGIAYRSSDGDLVLTEEAYDEKIAGLEARLAELPAKELELKNKILEFKNAKSRHYPHTVTV